MNKLANRVKETTLTAGIGVINLAGASPGYQSFVDGIGDGHQCYYALVAQAPGQWEIGVGTITAGSPDTLSRDSIIESSNNDALVAFAAGPKDVFVTVPADYVGYSGYSGASGYSGPGGPPVAGYSGYSAYSGPSEYSGSS